MIKLDRICVWLFIVNLLLMPVNSLYFSFADEILSYLMGVAALADCIINNNWKRYKLLWIISGILAIYWVNTILFRHYNTPLYVTIDLLMMLKPFLPLAVFYGMRISFTALEKNVLRGVCWFNVALMCLCVCIGELPAQRYIIYYIVFFGHTCMTSALVYLWTSIDDDGNIKQSDLLFILFTLVVGLWCGRSKYYGETVIFLFLLFLYRPGFITRMSLRNLIVLSLLTVIFFTVIWRKFSFYYLNPDLSINEAQESIARVALLLGMVSAISQHPLLGTGLASFGTPASAWHYSTFYIEEGLDKVWGLSPSKYDFVADNFIATFGGQFGLLGIACVVTLYVWFYKKINIYLHIDYPKYRLYYLLGMMGIICIVIENSNGNVQMVPCGIILYAMMGSLCSRSCLPTDIIRKNQCSTN